jgi:hypothetical protein
MNDDCYSAVEVWNKILSLSVVLVLDTRHNRDRRSFIGLLVILLLYYIVEANVASRNALTSNLGR